jgi:hypothetical protein
LNAVDTGHKRSDSRACRIMARPRIANIRYALDEVRLWQLDHRMDYRPMVCVCRPHRLFYGSVSYACQWGEGNAFRDLALLHQHEYNATSARVLSPLARTGGMSQAGARVYVKDLV